MLYSLRVGGRFYGLIPLSFQSSFFSKTFVLPGFLEVSGKKDPWKEWNWKVPLGFRQEKHTEKVRWVSPEAWTAGT